MVAATLDGMYTGATIPADMRRRLGRFGTFERTADEKAITAADEALSKARRTETTGTARQQDNAFANGRTTLESDRAIAYREARALRNQILERECPKGDFDHEWLAGRREHRQKLRARLDRALGLRLIDRIVNPGRPEQAVRIEIKQSRLRERPNPIG